MLVSWPRKLGAGGQQHRMIRSLVFTTQGRLHSRNIEMLAMPTLLSEYKSFSVGGSGERNARESRICARGFCFISIRFPSRTALRQVRRQKWRITRPKRKTNLHPYLFIVIHGVDYSRKDGFLRRASWIFFSGRNYLVTYHTGPLKTVTITEERGG